jgi:hypothetical protein
MDSSPFILREKTISFFALNKKTYFVVRRVRTYGRVTTIPY